MRTVIAKEYNWEMSHRLTFHKGLCKNLHGHSYKMRITIAGELNENAMVLDYYDIDKIVAPVLARFDHSFVCSDDDNLMINFLKENDFKYFIIDGYSTAENIVSHISKNIIHQFSQHKNIDTLTIRVYETFDAFAECTYKLS